MRFRIWFFCALFVTAAHSHQAQAQVVDPRFVPQPAATSSEADAQLAVEDEAFRAAVKQVIDEEAAKKKAAEEADKAQAACEGRLPSDRTMTATWNNGVAARRRTASFQAVELQQSSSR